MIQLCRHILTSGLICSQAAVKGTLFCRHHQTVKSTVAEGGKPAPYGAPPQLPLAYPEDRAGIQLDLFLVLQALNEGRIDNRTANTMNRLLNSAAANLAKGPLVEAGKEDAVQRVILTPQGEEIGPPREMLEEGESDPQHGRDCPCQRCAEEFRGADGEQHHADCRCGVCGEDSVRRSAISVEGAKSAAAAQLFDREPMRNSSEDNEDSLYDYKSVLREYEARQAAKAAGIAPPPKTYDLSNFESEGLKRYEATMEQVEKNKRNAKEIWERRFGSGQVGQLVSESVSH